MQYSSKKYPSHMTLVGEFNGKRAYEAANRKICPYPPFITVPETVTNEGKLYISPTYQDIVLYPEIFFVLGRDVQRKEGERVKDAILGYGISLGMNERSLVKEAEQKGGSPRDITACTWYQLYMDGTHIIGNELVESQFIDDITTCKLTLCIPGYEEKEFDMSNIMWKPCRLLEEMSELIPFRKYDRVYLGPVDAPIKIKNGLANNSKIIIKSNNYFNELTVTIQA